MNTSLKEITSRRWRENIQHLLNAVDKVAGYTDKKEILQTTAITMVYLLHAEAAVVSLWDPERQVITPQAFHTTGGWRLPGEWLSPRQSDSHVLLEKLMVRRESVQLNLGGMSIPLPAMRLMEKAGVQSWTAFPLLRADQSLLGVVDVFDSRSSRSFREDEIALGELLARLATATYQRALLIDQSELQARQLTALMDIVPDLSDLSASNDLDELLSRMSSVLGQVTFADQCRITVFHPSKNQKPYESVYIADPSASDRPVFELPDLATLVQEKRNQGTTVMLRVGRAEIRPEESTVLREYEIESLFIQPLEYEGLIAGWVELVALRKGKSETGINVSLLNGLANHFIRAIWMVWEQEEQNRTYNFLEGLVEASRALSSTLNWNELLGLILEQTVSVLKCKSANIMLITDGHARVVRFVGYEDQPKSLELVKTYALPLTTPTLAKMIETKKPVLVEDTLSWPDWLEVDDTNWIRSFVSTPLLIGDEVVGFLNMDSEVPGFFTPDVIVPLETFASVAASVLRNAQQFKTVQERASELEIVRQASLSLSSSLNLEEVLTTILKQSLDLFTGPRDGHIFLYQDGRLHFGAAMMGDGTKGEIWAEPRENGLTYTVARSGLPVIVDDMRKHPLFEGMPDDWVGSIAGLPLKYAGEVVGVMNIAHQMPYQFQEPQIRVLNLLADQAAISIVNARLYHLVQEQSLTDQLTGINNRRAFDRRLTEELLRAKRYERPFSLAMMDLNGFKRINDTYGHPVGDETLIRIAECLNENVRETDFLARYGGDEFALIMPETRFPRAKEITDRLSEAIAGYDFGFPRVFDLPITLSIGIAEFPEHGEWADELIAAADAALYRAKRVWRGENANPS